MTDHIKIPPILPRIAYVGNGTQTQFTFPFPIFHPQDLVVRLNDAIHLTGFTVHGAGQSNGGTVHFNTPPINMTHIILERRLPLQRISDFLEGGEFSANALNNELDYLAGSIQQIANDIVPTLHVPATEHHIVTTLPSKEVRANKVLGFDADGQMMMVDTQNTYSVPQFTAIGTGAVTRTLTDKTREGISIKDFGAVGDGIADDTQAFILAINAHRAVYVPSGDYRVTHTITLHDHTSLYGDGPSSRIIAHNPDFDVFHITGSYNIIQDLVIVGGDTALRLFGATTPCQQNTIRQLRITESTIGIALDGYENPQNPCCWNSISHVDIDNFKHSGVVLEKTGGGQSPIGNKFYSVRVYSNNASSNGYGFDIKSAKDNNAFLDCDIHLAPQGIACMRIAASCYKCLITNLYTQSTGPHIPGIWLEFLSYDTSITNLTANTIGEAVRDESEGSYNAFNAGDDVNNILRRTTITDLTTALQRYFITHFAPSSSSVMDIDMMSSVYLVNATNGTSILRFPKASADNDGVVVTVKKTDSSTNTVQLAEASGGPGPDGRLFKMGAKNDFATVISDGIAWHVINSNTMPFKATSFTGIGVFKPDLTHDLYLINATTAVVTVELPPANAAQSIGRMITIKKIDATTQQVRVTEEGAVGPDNAAFVITARYQAVTVMSNGSLWHVLSKFP
jgi:hypothetical protein